MIEHETLLVTLVKLVGRVPSLPPPARRRRGRPPRYPDRLFLQALVMMIVRHLHTVHALLRVLAQPTPEMQTLRTWLTVDGRFPTRRTWARRLHAIPATLPAQIGCLGRALVAAIRPWARCGRAAAIASTLLRARGGVWHKKDREASLVPHTSIDTEAHWTKSGWHRWVYGWKLPMVTTVAGVWLPLAADLTAANVADNVQALTLLPELPTEVRYVLGDQHYNDPAIDAVCAQAGQTVVATRRGPYPHTDDGVEVRRLLPELRSRRWEPWRVTPMMGATENAYVALWGLCAIRLTRSHFKTLRNVRRAHAKCKKPAAVVIRRSLRTTKRRKWPSHAQVRSTLHRRR